MAGSQIIVSVTALESQRLGHISMSWNNWTTNTEPTITKGSKIEISGSLFNFPADEDMDPGANWAGFGNDTIVYCKLTVSGTSCTSVLTATAPTWNDEKQGWYDGADRYYGVIYKDSGGNYTQKTILLNEELGYTNGGLSVMNSANEDKYIRLASDAAIKWDESETHFDFSQPIHMSNAPSAGTNKDRDIYFASDAALKWDESTDMFDLTKPIKAKYVNTVFASTSVNNKDIWDVMNITLPNVNDKIIISGCRRVGGNNGILSYAERASTAVVRLHYYDTFPTFINITSSTVPNYDIILAF